MAQTTRVSAGTAAGQAALSVGPMREHELVQADRIVHAAFAKFLEIADPSTFMEGRELVSCRYKADPDGVLALRAGDALIGSNVLTRWGSFGWFGPLTIDPANWGAGGAKLLLEQSMEAFERWGCHACALYTFADSAKHLHLYQKFGFWPRCVTAVLSKPATPHSTHATAQIRRLSELADRERDGYLDGAREVSDSLFQGLDLGHEITSTNRLGQSETLFVSSDKRVEAFAVCQYGAGSEAEPGTCYVKFGAVRSGREAARWFEHLLDACEHFAVAKELSSVVAGVNAERVGAYQTVLGRGYRIQFSGVQMFRNGEAAYNKPDAYVIDDLR